MEITLKSKDIRLDQLTAEIQALPGMSDIAGLSACGPSPEGETTLTLHCDEKALTPELQKSVIDAVERHSPDPQWGASKEEAALAQLAATKQGAMGLPELETAVRALAALVVAKPGDVATSEGNEKR